MSEKTRTFDSGANRNSEEGKLDYEGFLSPPAIERYALYLNEHRRLEDGTLRGSDNWQKGMPLTVYMKSAFRHFMAWWKLHRMMIRGRYPNQKLLEDAICGVIFNASGYLHEQLVEPRDPINKVAWDKEAEEVRQAVLFPEGISEPKRFTGFKSKDCRISSADRRENSWGNPDIGRRGPGLGRRSTDKSSEK